MTAPDITARLRTMSGMLQMGERIAYGSDAALMREAADEIASLRVQLDQAKQDHMSACRLVADMHAAATGRPGEGPVRGVVEDVADLRHQLQDMERERDVSRGNAQMHMEAARDLAVQLEAAQAECLLLREFFAADQAVSAAYDEVSPGLSSIPAGHGERVEAAIARRVAAAAAIHKARGVK
jgi:hypothetical protein